MCLENFMLPYVLFEGRYEYHRYQLNSVEYNRKFKKARHLCLWSLNQSLVVSIFLNPSCSIFLLKKRVSSAAHIPQICIVKIRKLRTYPRTLHFIFFHGILFSVIRCLESREWRHFIMTCRELNYDNFGFLKVKCKKNVIFHFLSITKDQTNF